MKLFSSTLIIFIIIFFWIIFEKVMKISGMFFFKFLRLVNIFGHKFVRNIDGGNGGFLIMYSLEDFTIFCLYFANRLFPFILLINFIPKVIFIGERIFFGLRIANPLKYLNIFRLNLPIPPLLKPIPIPKHLILLIRMLNHTFNLLNSLLMRFPVLLYFPSFTS